MPHANAARRSATAAIARLRRPLERRIREGHPWVFREALSMPADLPNGAAIRLHDQRGAFLAWALYDAGSPIALRVWSLDEAQPPEAPLMRQRLKSALAFRRACMPPDSSAYRMVHGEGDRMPGLVVDRYGALALIQLDGASLRDRITGIAEMLIALEPRLESVAWRRRGEPGLSWLVGAASDAPIVVQEGALRMQVDPDRGHKTGLFLDQRENRALIGRMAAGRRVLDCFCYSGGFGLSAALGGAVGVTLLDQAGPALAAAEQNFRLNDLDPEHAAYRFVEADAFAWLSESEASFDLIICDPPSMAPSAKQLKPALKAYARLAGACLDRLAPGGWLLFCSCSSHVDAADLRAILGRAAAKRRRGLRIATQRAAAMDHPTLPAFPEGDYLAALLIHAD